MESVSDLMNEIRKRIELLESSLPRRLDAMAVSETAKLPWKALFYREALIWRMAELSRSAFENLKKIDLYRPLSLLGRPLPQSVSRLRRSQFHVHVTHGVAVG